MDKIPSMNAVRLPQPARTPFEATDKSLSLAGLVDHFTEGSTSERLGLLKVSASKLEFEGTQVQLFRLEHGQPSTGLRAAASATAGVLGGMVTATVLVIIFAPLFFVLVETFIGKGRKPDRSAGGAGPVFTRMGGRFSSVKERFMTKRGNGKATLKEDINPSEGR